MFSRIVQHAVGASSLTAGPDHNNLRCAADVRPRLTLVLTASAWHLQGVDYGVERILNCTEKRTVADLE